MDNRHPIGSGSKNGKAIVHKMTMYGPAQATPFIQIQNLSKSYQEGDRQRKVFTDISLNLMQGEIVAILGKSGSGKTTLLNLLSGIDRVDAGEIYMEGLRITGLDDQQLTLFRRRTIGFIFQSYNLIPTLNVWENLVLPLELNNMTSPADFQRAEVLLATVGLSDRKTSFPDRLSGGEQQRVSIARALVHQPRLVLADEPTGNLDEETGGQILELLDQLTRRSDQSMVLVTHSAEAAAIADRVLTLHEGHLIEQVRAR